MFKNIVLAGTMFAIFCVPFDAHAEDKEVTLVRQAMEYEEKGNYDSAFHSLIESLKIIDSKKDYDKGKKNLIRQYLFFLFHEQLMVYSNGNQSKKVCSTVTSWMKLSSKYSPSPSETEKNNEDYHKGFVAFPTLLLFQSFCACENSKRSVAIGYQTTALDYRPHLQSEFLIVFDQTNALISQNINLGCGGPTAAPDPFDIGAYVTNKGGFQDWIGVVVKSEKKTLDVRITYHRTDDGRVGQTMNFTRDEAQQLKAVSVDALTKGWQ